LPKINSSIRNNHIHRHSNTPSSRLPANIRSNIRRKGSRDSIHRKVSTRKVSTRRKGNIHRKGNTHHKVNIRPRDSTRRSNILQASTVSRR
jgi:hypothetical protein